MPLQKPVIFLIVVAASTLLWNERDARRRVFALTALLALTCLPLFFTGDLERAGVLAVLIAAAIAGVSRVKFYHSARKLVAADVALLFAGTVRFFFVQYRRMMLGVSAGAVALIAAAVATLLHPGGVETPLAWRVVLAVAAPVMCAVAYRGAGGAAAFRRAVVEPGGYLSTFAASVFDTAAWLPSRNLSLPDMAADALPLAAAMPARNSVLPDIIFIQHESVFDPRVFGLEAGPEVAALQTPSKGLSGKLSVDIYGGGSWQSEFSVITGISSDAFGADAYFLFKRGVGRFRHSLPGVLAALGYKTMLASSCRRSFLNYDAFYGAIGMAERVFSDDFPAPFDGARFEATNSDAQFLDAAVAAFERSVATDPAPRFLYALTNANHGPHSRRLVPRGQFEDQRAFALRCLPDAEYAEYYARLAETAAAWKRQKAKLAAAFPRRPTLVVHYGDHQPVMTRRIEARLGLPDDAVRAFTTFYAIEGINFELEPAISNLPVNLHIAFLGTVALQAAGLPLDAIYATRAGLLADSADAVSIDDRRRRLLRTLVDRGLIDLAPRVSPPHAAAYRG